MLFLKDVVPYKLIFTLLIYIKIDYMVSQLRLTNVMTQAEYIIQNAI